MSTLRDLQSAAVSDLAAQAQADAAKVAADAAVARSSPVFAAALKAEPGGFSIDVKASPPVVYTAAADGSTFTTATASSLDDPAPDSPATPS